MRHSPRWTAARDEMERAFRAGDLDAYLGSFWSLRDACYACAVRPRLLRALEDQRIRVERYILYLCRDPEASRIRRAPDTLLEACRARDGEAAEQATRDALVGPRGAAANAEATYEKTDGLMSFLLACPHCGPRDVNEFALRGRGDLAPEGTPTLRELAELRLLPPQRRRRAARVVAPPPRLRGLVPRRARHAHERGAAHGDPRPARAGGRRLMRLAAAAGERIDRIARGHLHVLAASRCGPTRATRSAPRSSRAGQRVFSRSFKYHRPRGLLCCSGSCANCMMTGRRRAQRPRLRRAGPRGRGRRAAERDAARSTATCSSVMDKVGGPFTPGRLLLPHDDPAAAGLAALREGPAQRRRARASSTSTPAARRFDVEHRRAEVLVIGGGRAGLEAARQRRPTGGGSCSWTRAVRRPVDGVEVIAPGRALGV